MTVAWTEIQSPGWACRRRYFTACLAPLSLFPHPLITFCDFVCGVCVFLGGMRDVCVCVWSVVLDQLALRPHAGMQVYLRPAQAFSPPLQPVWVCVPVCVCVCTCLHVFVWLHVLCVSFYARQMLVIPGSLVLPAVHVVCFRA